MNAKVRRIVKFLNANLHRQVSVAEVAAAVGLSPSRVHELFKAELGVAPMRYHKTLRLEKAGVLLEASTLKVKQIQLEVGYQDQRQFFRDFKGRFGLTPVQYRARQAAAKLTADEPTAKKQEN